MAGGVAEITIGCELCTTVVGFVQGIPMIVFKAEHPAFCKQNYKKSKSLRKI